MAQMIMMSDWHPDIIEFIISKMQNPKVLKWLSENSKDETIREEAKKKLTFTPLTKQEIKIYESIIKSNSAYEELKKYAKDKLDKGGVLKANNEEFLTGANISVNITKDFMEAVKNDETYDLRFPDLENYTTEEKEYYDKHWHEVGDVREWEKLGYASKIYKTVKAKDIWDLISFCSTYSAEPGIFFIDNANDMTNSWAYFQKVLATNPCGEQPLPAWSVCNLAAINLANFVDKYTGQVMYDKLAQSVRIQVRLQDNVIDATPYFLEENKQQALGERRVGLGVMGLHDLLIWAKVRYGSPESIVIINKVFRTIAESAYAASVDIAKQKGSFPFLKDNRERFVQSGFMQHLSQELRDDIVKYGIRNSHLLTIAPTGSTGTMVGVSTGLEPYFSFSYFRSGRLGKFIEVKAEIVNEWLKYNPEYSADNLPHFFVSAMELKPEEHADVQTAIQYWIDSSISKTVNAPKGFTVKQVQGIYEQLYKNGAKGGTVYVDGSRDTQVLSLGKEDNEENWNHSEEIKHVEETSKQDELSKPKESLTLVRADRLDREIGIEIGDICPICMEGQVENLGGCNTCTNCNAQLKCGL